MISTKTNKSIQIFTKPSIYSYIWLVIVVSFAIYGVSFADIPALWRCFAWAFICFWGLWRVYILLKIQSRCLSISADGVIRYYCNQLKQEQLVKINKIYSIPGILLCLDLIPISDLDKNQSRLRFLPYGLCLWRDAMTVKDYKSLHFFLKSSFIS
jgi:hypothetical protein